ncbi:uncharacterized protein LOC120000277 isoform X1 [Tripterygium wilfordii]|uniref:uncharacterized protein LOC120000277 isoform X1 n=1 Tax=Tripterygium wilfordii TaxID=458696 RepID=UPI0018F7EDA8|nr:uncharacterized protein LOC120000277 isoform X1 [Tripterygium wilfordii]XP_038704192.1 uncharacterized protein LOC120000277 isoform X1 [Tripterygium wilfordii]XP_038704193.1 uncharacterized protein LOC120000277 isoform X1 [Tripterygium wilfordii]XP_038704194.1 uncharacterized protein LOC120000277 isoform X1 [Tripterygium wilfordii]XP_038704195.1 uncharacterized protein LOC120000277 isoform X1 [Tripterygium wilfordii]XP_038704196.1 uncharacterized protein LOC120000277 isoform X1 [Tripterygiu
MAATMETDDDNENNKGSMWALDQKLDQPMDEEAGSLKNIYRENFLTFPYGVWDWNKFVDMKTYSPKVSPRGSCRKVMLVPSMLRTEVKPWRSLLLQVKELENDMGMMNKKSEIDGDRERMSIGRRTVVMD